MKGTTANCRRAGSYDPARLQFAVVPIIEVKGGFTASGQSENIDAYAEKKAAALAAYCARRGVRGGFVCHDESEDVLLVSEDGFSENPKAACWRLLA